MTLESTLEFLFDQAQKISIYYDPNKDSPSANEVLIGIGRNQHQGLILNSPLTKWNSTSELIYRIDQTIVNQWIEDYGQSIEKLNFFVEDISPDTIFAYLLWAIRVNGFSYNQIPYVWINYINNWKKGDVHSTGKPFQSWGCLQSALAHAFFSKENSIRDIKKPFLISLRFLISLLLKQGLVPNHISDVDHIDEYQIARTFLNYEHHQYLNSYESASKLQLVLPIHDSNQKAVVDAFISTQKAYLGAIKYFARTDTTRTWVQSGFSFMGLNRPALNGTGNDIVISIDPSMRIHLKDLWYKLEELENMKWNEQRPLDHASLLPKQPWYFDRDYTLVAVPKKIDDKTYGSKLTWQEVIDTLWELYNPANSLLVKPYQSDGAIGESCSIYQCLPINDPKSKKHLIACKWHQFELQESLITSPTMKQILAASATRISPSRLPSIHELPSENTYDFLEIPGGYAVIHAEGVLLLDDWQDEPIHFLDYKREFNKLESRLVVILQMKSKIMDKVKYIQERLQNHKTLSSKHLIELNHWIASQKINLREKILETSPSINYDLKNFYHTIEQRWGLETQLNELYDSVSEIENIIKGYVDTHTNRLVSRITIFGFPLVLFGGMFQFIFQGIPNPKWLSLWGVHWLGFFLFLSLTGISILTIPFFLKNSNQRLSLKELREIERRESKKKQAY